MAVNKVVFGNTTIIDLTGDNVTAADVAAGKVFHLPSGAQTTGTAIIAEANAVNYSVLPATGAKNDIAIINGSTVNNTYVCPTAPESPAEGDVWLRTGWSGRTYLQYGKILVYLTSCKQYVSGSWVVIPTWYVYISSWVRGRYYLIQDGVAQVTFTTKKWKETSGASTPGGTTSYTTGSGYVQVYHKNTSTNAGEYGCAGIISPQFNAGQYSEIYVSTRSTSSYSSCDRRVHVLRPGDSYVTQAPLAGGVLSTANSWTNKDVTYSITQTDDPCVVYFGMNVRNNGNTTTLQIYNCYLQ